MARLDAETISAISQFTNGLVDLVAKTGVVIHDGQVHVNGDYVCDVSVYVSDNKCKTEVRFY